MLKNKEEALEELKEIIDCFEDLSRTEDDRADYYLDRLHAVYDALTEKDE